MPTPDSGPLPQMHTLPVGAMDMDVEPLDGDATQAGPGDAHWLQPRLATVATAAAMVLACSALMALGAMRDVVDAGFVVAWTVFALAGIALMVAGWTSGWLTRDRESLAVMLHVMTMTALCAWGYAQLGPLRGAMLPLAVASILYGVFTTGPTHLRWVGLWTLLAFAAAIGWGLLRDPAGHPWLVEVAHGGILAITVPSVVVLSTRLAVLRARNRRQREDLSAALQRIEQLATHDSATGLINRRHMHVLLRQEHQRSIRSGQSFCVALMALVRHGAQPVDAEQFVQMAREAGGAVRGGDLLGRWAGDAFVLTMPETRLQMAVNAVARVQLHVQALASPPCRLVYGVAEHCAGETTEQTLERAATALARARQEQVQAQAREPSQAVSMAVHS